MRFNIFSEQMPPTLLSVKDLNRQVLLVMLKFQTSAFGFRDRFTTSKHNRRKIQSCNFYYLKTNSPTREIFCWKDLAWISSRRSAVVADLETFTPGHLEYLYTCCYFWTSCNDRKLSLNDVHKQTGRVPSGWELERKYSVRKKNDMKSLQYMRVLLLERCVRDLSLDKKNLHKDQSESSGSIKPFW